VLALGAVALIAGAPAMIGLLLIAGQPGALAWPMLVIALGYAAYLALWAVLIVLVSALVHRRRDALLALVALWAVALIVLPRVAPDVASAAVPLENRLQTDVAIARDLRKMGDSHNPDDPHFAAFKQSVLDRYGVAKIEDLPVNYKGILGVEGERMTASLFNRYATDSFVAQARQNGIVETIGLLSPAIALRSLSMAAAGTDLDGHRRFLEQAEAYRYALVQRLNRMQAEAVSYAPSGATLALAALPGLAILGGWLVSALVLLGFATRRLGARR
jgi:ABC-2 type transport system permease protein